MNATHRIVSLALVAAMGFASAGCESQRNFAQEHGAAVGAVGGALIGAGAGALIDGDNRGRGALIGAGVGAAAGAGLGYMVQRQYNQMKKIQDLQVRQAQLDVQNSQLAAEVQQLKSGPAVRDTIIVTVPGEVLFEKSSYALTPHGRGKVAEIAQVLRDDPSGLLDIRGYASSEGDPNYNLTLSQQRADAVAAELIANGIPRNRMIAVVGMGINSPVASNATESGRAQNRRVEITIIPSTQ